MIAARHGTDKWNSHWYAGHYGEHLHHLTKLNCTILEIGVGGYDDPKSGGASLRAWKEYFPQGQIIGLDYYNKKSLEEDRISIYEGSQADPIVIAKILSDYPAGFDVVIDDGSHRSEHVIASLLMLWQYVKTGGWYIVEDLQTSYWPSHGGLLYERNSSQTSMGFLKSLVDCLNWKEIHQPGYSPNQFDLTITEIHFYHNLVFLKKGENTERSTSVIANRINGV